MKNDGGYAFPTFAAVGPTGTILHGMSLRDYFAASALTGAIASWAHPDVDLKEGYDAQRLAKSCYQFADAMLAERVK